MIWTAATGLAGILVEAHPRRRGPALGILIAEHGLVRGVALGVKWRVPQISGSSGVAAAVGGDPDLDGAGRRTG